MKQRMVVIIVHNSLGQLFVHQRNAEKKIYPSLYGLGAGGHVEPGELPSQAAKRELKEELNIQTNIKPLFNIDFKSAGINHIVQVFSTLYIW
jgi:8-oxo-dGTP pyrophosphatase MutT (NUDIX family)